MRMADHRYEYLKSCDVTTLSLCMGPLFLGGFCYTFQAVYAGYEIVCVCVWKGRPSYMYILSLYSFTVRYSPNSIA